MTLKSQTVVTLMACLMMAGAALGQTAAPVPPTLSRPIQMQMQVLAQEVQQVSKDFEAVNEQVKKELPGYHLDNNLKLEKDAAPVTKVEPPVKK